MNQSDSKDQFVSIVESLTQEQRDKLSGMIDGIDEKIAIIQECDSGLRQFTFENDSETGDDRPIFSLTGKPAEPEELEEARALYIDQILSELESVLGSNPGFAEFKTEILTLKANIDKPDENRLDPRDTRPGRTSFVLIDKLQNFTDKIAGT